MITCERCKAANLDGGQYCDECGAPLRPNQRSAASSTSLIKPQPDGQNGSHSPVDAPQPEIAARNSGPAVNRSAAAAVPDKPHAKLVIERGKSVGKQFLMNS